MHNLLKIASILYTCNLQEATKRKRIAMEKQKINVSWNFMKSGRKNLKTEKSTEIRKRRSNRFLTGKKNMKYSLIVASRSMRNEV